jgi:hypothetical protein
MLENTFTSLPELVGTKVPKFLHPIMNKLMRIDWPTYKRIQGITLPIFFTTGHADMVCPSYISLKLHDLAVNTIHKVLYVEEKGDHFNTWMLDFERYVRELD